jgi:hypothetical protein
MFGHRVDRRRVWHDGHEHRSACTTCRRPMIRGFGPWRLFDSATDASVTRKPHPLSHIPN